MGNKLIINYNKILRFTNHLYISKTFLNSNNILNLLKKKKPDLVVILYYNFDKIILKEILFYQIPIIRVDLFFKQFNKIRNSHFLIKILFNEFINILIVIIFSLLKKQIKSNFDILSKINFKKKIYIKNYNYFLANKYYVL